MKQIHRELNCLPTPLLLLKKPGCRNNQVLTYDPEKCYLIRLKVDTLSSEKTPAVPSRDLFTLCESLQIRRQQKALYDTPEIKTIVQHIP